MTRGALLAAYVRATRGPVVWGVSDCSTWPAQWVAEATGREVRWPAYASEDEARTMMADAGGLVPLWRDVAESAGLRERDPALEAPAPGDVGVMLTRRFGDVGVIFGPLAGVPAGPWLAYWRSEDGARPISIRRATLRAVWEV